jgi:cyclophilin family peptidyl-prolyl cis-trans isomerase
MFAIRALGRTTKDAVRELVRVTTDRSFLPAERAEAARALGLLGEPGQAGIAEALARLVPDKDPFAIAAIGADEYGPMAALAAALGGEVPKKGEPAIGALAHLNGPGTPPAPLARRLASLRCTASLALARAAFDADILRKCDSEGSPAWEKARLAALVRRPLVGERRAAWKVLARSKNTRVREDAIEAFSLHAELGDVGRQALAEALASKHAGLVATAAAVVQAHPDRVMGLAASEKRAALDPASPPPTANPALEVDRAIAKALGDAIAFRWPEDLVETRANLLDAAVAAHLPSAKSLATAACRDANVTVRDRASKALRTLGETGASCVAASPSAAADEVGHEISKDTRVVFQTDGGEVAIRFEPALAPLSATRFVALARAGFFKDIVVHRVVPGFVVQFGDPGADGYGGAGKLLRDEASPVPFGPLDVGVALAGRDTGSSQLFVTLARYPHLDGEYARIGRAEGDWSAIAEDDVVRDVRVESE